MMGILTVTGDEIEQVTRKKRRQAQAKVLKALGIRLQIRPDGTLLVFRTSLGIPH
ncbi:PF13986 domain protein [Bordetella pertussis H934]|nr:PF13986 domain protein [Bordetella pertussis B200]KCV24199.1 PF13986 domain protein [Bordetella pertussis H934]